jgi:IclR family transcriptional regulator, pca regulon regulatory protein
MRSGSSQNEEDGRAAQPRVEALARGLAILATFSGQEPWLGLSEIARRVGLTTPTTQRLLNTLRLLGYAEQSASTKCYRPSLAVLRLGYAAITGLGLREVALPHLQSLSESTGETVNLAVLAGNEIVYIERIKRTELITTNVHVGSRLPAYCTSMGKVLLADLEPHQRNLALDGIAMDATGPNTITNRADLERELSEVRERGFAIQDEELVAGLRSVAAPVRDRTGRAVAALNIAVSARRVPRHALLYRLAPRVLETAAAISSALGFEAVSSAPA